MAEVASAYVSLMPSAKGFGSKLNSEISGDIDKSGKKAGLSFGKLFAAGAALGIGAKAFSFLGDSLAEATDAAVIGSRTENVIAKMGNAAGISAKQVGNLAGAISNKTGIDDEAIQSGQNLLLTFGNIRNEAGKGNDIFNQTSRLMVDMSAAMGTDAKGSAIQLGKALNDPVKGLTALSRVGVSFTAQQKEQIAAMVATGNTMGAQKVILGELERQFGGAAAAMTTPAEKAKVAWGNLQEQFGTLVLPMFNSVATTISTRVVPAVSRFITQFQTGVGAGGRFASVLRTTVSVLGALAGFIDRNRAAVGTFVGIVGTAIVVTKAWRAAQAVLNVVLAANPIGLVIVAIAALAAGLVIAYKRSETFRNIVNGAFASVKAIAGSVASFITSTIPAAFNSAVSAVNKAWSAIRSGGQTVVAFVKGLPAAILAVFTGAAASFYNAGSQLMGQLAAGITDKIGDAIAAAQAGLSRLKGLLPGSPIKWGPLKNWNNGGAGKRLMDLVAKGITAATPKTVKAAQAAFDKISESLTATRDDLRSKLQGFKSDFEQLASSVSGAFTGGLFDVEASEGKSVGQGFIDNLMGKKAELTGLLASFNTLKGWGIAPAFLSQLFASGNGALITELAGMGQGAATQTASLFGEVSNLSSQLGTAVAQNDPVASRIDETNRLLTVAVEQLEFLGSDIGKELNQAASKARRNKKGRGKK